MMPNSFITDIMLSNMPHFFCDKVSMEVTGDIELCSDIHTL